MASWFRALNVKEKAIRMVNLSKYNAHTDPGFKQLNILKAQDINNTNFIINLHNKLPAFVVYQFLVNRSDLIKSKIDTHSLYGVIHCVKVYYLSNYQEQCFYLTVIYVINYRKLDIILLFCTKYIINSPLLLLLSEQHVYNFIFFLTTFNNSKLLY